MVTSRIRYYYTTMGTPLYLFFFKPCPWHLEVPGPGIKPAHSSDLGHCHDKDGSLTQCATRELHRCTFYNFSHFGSFFFKQSYLSVISSGTPGKHFSSQVRCSGLPYGVPPGFTPGNRRSFQGGGSPRPLTLV